MWHYILKAASAKSGQDSPISGVPQEHKMTQHILFTIHTPLSEDIPSLCSPPEQRCPDCFFLLPAWLSVLPRSSVRPCIATQMAFRHFLAPAFAITPSKPLLLNSLCSGLVLQAAPWESASRPPFLNGSNSLLGSLRFPFCAATRQEDCTYRVPGCGKPPAPARGAAPSTGTS